MGSIREENKQITIQPEPNPLRLFGYIMKLSKAIKLTLPSWVGMKSEGQLTQAANKILKELGDVELASIDLKELNKTIWKDLAPATRKKRCVIIGKIITESGWEGDKPAVPKIKVNNSNPEYLTQSQVDSILTACDSLDGDSKCNGAYFKQWVTFLLETGCRPYEALALTWDCLAKNHINMAIIKFKVTKNGKARTIPASKNVAAILQNMGRKAPSSSARIWDRCSIRTFQNKWYEVSQIVGLPGTGWFSMYILRHTSASMMLQRGVPIASVSDDLGHSSLEITRRYAKLGGEQLMDAANTFEVNEEF